MALNATFRKTNYFLAVPELATKQSAFGTPLLDATIDTRENCTVEIESNLDYGEELSCDQRDIINQPVKTRFRRFRLTFDRFTAKQAFRYLAYKEGATTAPTGTPANQVQTLTRSGTVSGGTFTLALTIEGRTGTTKPIAWDASNSAILAAINARFYGSLGKLVKTGDVAVSGSWGTAISLTFGNRLAKANIPLLVVDATNLTGTTPDIDVAILTAGANKYHTATRAADGSKALFSIATGELNGAIATRKYGDCVVESVDFNVSSDNTNASMVVLILCPYTNEEITGFSVPPCINGVSVKAEDVRYLIDGVYEQENLVSHKIALNDNIPVNAGFAFFDIDVTREFEAGNKPSQEFTSEIFGKSDHVVYQLAENADVEGNEVATQTHFGNPGHRVSIVAPETKIKPQTSIEGYSTEAKLSTIKFLGTPYGISQNPFSVEYYGDETTQFLLTE